MSGSAARRRFNSATAFVIADAQQPWAIHNTTRNVFRALVVLLIVGATVALVCYKYVTDSPLRASLVITREQNVKSLNQGTIEVAVCPCREESFSYGTFVSVSDRLANNETTLYNLCETLIVPELAGLAQPTENSSPAELQAYMNAVSALQRNVAALASCGIALQQIVNALSPDPLLSGLAEKWVNSDLLSERQVRLRLDTFLGAKSLQYEQGFTGQLLLQKLVLGNLLTNISSLQRQASQSNDTAFVTAANVAAYDFQLFYNVTENAGVALAAATTGDAGYIVRLAEMVKNAVAINYDDYMDACSAPYCDFTQVKTVQARVVEFFAVLGGVYTTVLGIGVLLWFIIDLLLPASAAGLPVLAAGQAPPAGQWQWQPVGPGPAQSLAKPSPGQVPQGVAII